MSRIPVFVEKSPRKGWDKSQDTCIFIACDQSNSDLNSTAGDIDIDNKSSAQTAAKNTSLYVSVVSCIKGVVNSSCNCPHCEAEKRCINTNLENNRKNINDIDNADHKKSETTKIPVKLNVRNDLSKVIAFNDKRDAPVIGHSEDYDECSEPECMQPELKRCKNQKLVYLSQSENTAKPVTYVLNKNESSKPTERLSKLNVQVLKKTGIPVRNAQPVPKSCSISANRSSAIPCLKNPNRRALPKPPTENRSVRYGQKVVNNQPAVRREWNSNVQIDRRPSKNDKVHNDDKSAVGRHVNYRQKNISIGNVFMKQIDTNNENNQEVKKLTENKPQRNIIKPTNVTPIDKNVSLVTVQESVIPAGNVNGKEESSNLKTTMKHSRHVPNTNDNISEAAETVSKVVENVRSAFSQNVDCKLNKHTDIQEGLDCNVRPKSTIRTNKPAETGLKAAIGGRRQVIGTLTTRKGNIVPFDSVAGADTNAGSRPATSNGPRTCGGTARVGGEAGTRPPSGAGAASASSGSASKKRPAWDLKGRLHDMEAKFQQSSQERNDFMSQMNAYNERIALLENTNTQLSGTVAQKEEHATNAYKENDGLRKQLRETDDDLHNMKRQFERETESYEFTKASLRRQKESLEGEISTLQHEVLGLKTSVAQLTSSQAGLSSQLEATKLSLETALREGRDKDGEILRLRASVKDKEEIIDEFNVKFRQHETMRRQLHNTIQELKGNIRVFCRVRPLVGEELYGHDGDIQHMNFPDEEHKVLEMEKLGDIALSESTISGFRKGQNRYEFQFDQVFQPSSSQATVFEEISQLVQSALDGYNVCIFAYGQTGSGKTYTMEGPSIEDEKSCGMIARAVIQIFTSTHELEDKGWQYEFEASFLEIYNETIRDLLGNGKDDVKHEIKLTGTGSNDVTVTHLTTVPVTCQDQIVNLLAKASKNRAVGETACNERSSRSHSVFRLKITGANDITSERCQGTLNLVDLAGSERLKESGATGQRLKETQNINKSLSNLGNVIMALGNKESHVPYRNSRLTYLLQNSLGGNSKTLMFVNVSPREEHFGETLNSLRFATKVNQCNIGTATKKVK